MRPEIPKNKPILVISDAPLTGGSADFLKLILSVLDSSGARIDLALTEPSHRSLASTQYQKFELAGVQVDDASWLLPKISETISSTPSRIFRLALYLVEGLLISRRLGRISARYSHVIVSTSYPGRFAGLRMRLSKTTFFFHSYPVGKFHKLMGIFFGRLLDSRSTVVFVSRSLQLAYSRLWRLKSAVRQRVIWTSKGAQPSRPRNHRHQPPVSSIRVLTAGAITKEKGADLWVDVIRKVVTIPNMKKVKFTWLGDGPLKEKIASSLVDSNLKEFGYLPGHVEDVDNFYRSADIYLHLSRRESLGLAVVNALRFGLPVVAIETGGIAEIVQNGVSGILVHEDSATAVATALVSLIGQPGMIELLGYQSYIFYGQNLSLQLWETQLLEAIFDKSP